jgi:hypothetical protein
MKLKNNTGGVSKIGYAVKIDPNDKLSFIYATASDTQILGIITESVPYRSLCEVATSGTALVFVSANVVRGDVIRNRKSSDGISNGQCAVAKSTDTSYVKIGYATTSGRGLVSVSLGFEYLSSTSVGSLSETYETVSKNIKGYPYVITYAGSDIDFITYTTPSGTIVKTFNYTGSDLTSLVLSGDTPSGINLTKTLHYTGSDLTSVSYS